MSGYSHSSCTIDPYKYLQIILNQDGSITRNPNRYPNTQAISDLNHSTFVLTKDVSINQSNHTWARVFLPRHALDIDFSSNKMKLPLLIYYHAGGFIHCSAASTIFHEFCTTISINIPVIIVAIDYRLAPEHRLPAAYEDAMDALYWMNSTEDDWLTSYADFSNCFIMGSSSGGNIAYHVGSRLVHEAENLQALKIKGLVLHQPYFGGCKRTESELRMVNDPRLPLSVNDLMWELSLPLGADRDHEYCNPTAEGASKELNDQMKVLMIGCDGDPLIDRQVELVGVLRQKGISVEANFGVGGYHSVHIMESAKAAELCALLKEFIGHK